MYEPYLRDVELIEKLLGSIVKRLNINERDIADCWLRLEEDRVRLSLITKVDHTMLSPEEQRFHWYNELLYGEVMKIKAYVIEYIYSISSEAEKREHISSYHHEIVRLSLQALAQVSEQERENIRIIGNKKRVSEIYKITYNYLRELLVDLEMKFYPYMDHSLIPTEYWQGISEKALRPMAERIMAALAKGKVSNELSKCIMLGYNRLLLPKTYITYEQITGYKKLYNELAELVENHNIDEQRLSSFLYYQNYNSYDFGKYYYEQISKTFEMEEGLFQRFYKIKRLVKQYKKKETLETPTFCNTHHTVREHVLRGLEAELTTTKERLDQIHPESVPVTIGGKLVVYIFKVFFETKLYGEMKKSKLVRIIQGYIIQGNKSLGKGTIDKYFKSPELDVKLAAIDVFERCISYIREDIDRKG